MEGGDRLVRASVLRVMTREQALDVVGRDGSLRRLEGSSAELARVVLAFHETPRTRDELLAEIETQSGEPLGEQGASVVDALAALLVEAGALVRPPSAAPRIGGRVVLGMGGAVAAAHAPLLVQGLLARGIEVRVVASERALRFVSREALEVLTHAPVRASMFAEGEAPPERVPHVELAAWADLVVIWPATATMIGRIATGDCSELVSAIAVATRAPVMIAPSMNEAMLEAKAVARNLETLRADGFHVVESSLAHEVADAPHARAPMRGGAPDAASLALMIEALLRTLAPVAPRDAASWEAFHRLVPETEHAWFGGPDTTVLAALDARARTGSLWDVGTGHGALAVAAAARGFSVVATDVSDTALARAQARAGDTRVVWLRDDVTRSVLRARFDVILDRGTLHVLPPAARGAWARAITACAAPGALVIVTTHAADDPRLASHPMTAAEVAALLGDAFAVEETLAGRFEGSVAPAPESVTTVLRRRA